MCQCVLAELYKRGEGLSRRSGVPSRRTCSSSGLHPGLRPASVIYPADAPATFESRIKESQEALVSDAPKLVQENDRTLVSHEEMDDLMLRESACSRY